MKGVYCMNQKIKAVGLILLITMFMSGCGGNISQTEYDAVLAEKDELQEMYESAVADRDNWKEQYDELSEAEEENLSASLSKAKETFALFDGISFSESENGGNKALIITVYIELGDDVRNNFEKLGSALAAATKQEWFDYNHVFVNVWNNEPGMITSMTVDTSDLSIKEYQWLSEDDESDDGAESSKENNKKENTENNQEQQAEDPAEVTTGQRNALRKAQSYLNISAFSYNGLKDQLEYEGFEEDEIQYAVDNCGADWMEQAVKKAKSYLDISAFSKSGLIDQLEYEGFTHEQAVYGAEQNGL